MKGLFMEGARWDRTNKVDLLPVCTTLVTCLFTYLFLLLLLFDDILNVNRNHD